MPALKRYRIQRQADMPVKIPRAPAGMNPSETQPLRAGPLPPALPFSRSTGGHICKSPHCLHTSRTACCQMRRIPATEQCRVPTLSRKQRRPDAARTERNKSAEGIAHLVERVNTQRVQDRCREVLRREGIVLRVRGKAVRPAEYPAASHRSSRDEQRIAVRPVVASGLIDSIAGVLTEPRCAAEFPHADDQSALQQSAHLKVLEERRKALIERRQQFLLEPAVVLDVRVPVREG